LEKTQRLNRRRQRVEINLAIGAADVALGNREFVEGNENEARLWGVGLSGFGHGKLL
jgi:hypothetical protein